MKRRVDCNRTQHVMRDERGSMCAARALHVHLDCVTDEVARRQLELPLEPWRVTSQIIGIDITGKTNRPDWAERRRCSMEKGFMTGLSCHCLYLYQ